jgi:hypothetical protein
VRIIGNTISNPQVVGSNPAWRVKEFKHLGDTRFNRVKGWSPAGHQRISFSDSSRTAVKQYRPSLIRRYSNYYYSRRKCNRVHFWQPHLFGRAPEKVVGTKSLSTKNELVVEDCTERQK